MCVTARLSAAGYPAPRYRLAGVQQSLRVVYSIQEELPGAPLHGWLNAKVLDHLLQVKALQQVVGRAMTPALIWPQPVAEAVLYGAEGFCLLDPLQSCSGETAVILEVQQRLATAGGEERSPHDDAVHFDFQGAKILVVVEEGQRCSRLGGLSIR